MSIDAEQLDSFAALGTALGLLRDGELNGAWFEDPVGSAATADERGLATVMYDDEQRAGLLAFVDDVLGPPGRTTTGGAIWVPLFQEASPAVTIFAVIRELAGVVHVGIGVEHAAGSGAPSVETRLHVPIFQLSRSGAPNPPTGGGLPDWLLLGRNGGRIELTADVTISAAAPVPGVAFIGGLAVTLGIPTGSGDDLHIALTLRDLQLPGATAPRTFELDAASVDELGPEVFELITGLIRAQADVLDMNDAALRPFAALTGLLGLRDVANLPPLPLADIPTAGISAVVSWAEGLLADNDSRDAWLGQLGLLVGGNLDALNDAVNITVGSVTVSLGVRVGLGTGGHPILVPWVDVHYDIRPGAKVSLAADLLRADTSTGQVTAMPSLRAEAVFGLDAAGARLLVGDPGVASLHLGVGLSDLRTPQFVLTLHDVTLGGHHHDILDLSTPQAALDAANDAIDGALVSALDALGDGGALVATLIGLDPPVGVTGTDATALLADPLGALASYWNQLTANGAATAVVFGQLRQLLLGVPATSVPGDGTRDEPWRVDLVGSSGLRLWVEAHRLSVALAATIDTPALGDFTATTSLTITLASVDLVGGSTTFADTAKGAVSLHRTDAAVASLSLDRVTIEASAVELGGSWASSGGLQVRVAAPGLTVVIAPQPGPASVNGPVRVGLSLPTFDSTGNVVFTPVWNDVERAVGALFRELGSPVLDALVDLVGWDFSGGAHLALGDLIAAPRAAIEAWLADVVLDCDNVRAVAGPLAALMSGFRVTQPFGAGSERSPMRCPIAGEARAPGVAVWLDPGCPPQPARLGLALDRLVGDVPPEPSDIVAVLRDAATVLPDVADLLVSRDGLAAGFQQLIDRWTATDGLSASPTALPDGVTSLTLDGYSYGELAALGASGALVGDVFDLPPSAVVHVVSDDVVVDAAAAAGWLDASVIDATGSGALDTILPAAAGTWLVRLPSIADANAARPDRGGVGEQAERLASVLALRTNPISVIAYGPTGAAAIRTAFTATSVDQVATVGTPWAALSIESLRTGLGGDALRVLGRLSRSESTEWPSTLFASEASDLERIRRIVARSMAAVGGKELPSVETEVRRAGVRYRAVFGSMNPDSIAAGVAALVADGVDARLQHALDVGAATDVLHTALHIGIDLPVIDLDLAGLLVGVGATLEVLTLDRGPLDTLGIHVARGVIVDVHLGVHDGWLVGGPGASTSDLELRWMSARVRVPFDGTDGSTEFVLHDAKAFGIDRERWVVNVDGVDVHAAVNAEISSSATTIVPEVRVLLGEVVTRLLVASTPLGDLLAAIGLVRDGGLDPDGLDRLVHDTATTIETALTSAGTQVAASLRTLTSSTGTGSSIGWTTTGATMSLDFAARTASVAVVNAGIDGIPEIGASISFSAASASASATIGSLDAHAGGLRLVAHAGAASSLGVEWQAPGAAGPNTVAVLPVADVAGLERLATTVVPAAVTAGLGCWLRSELVGDPLTAVDTVLDQLDLLGNATDSGTRTLRLPLGLFTDPVGWLRQGATAWRTDPITSAITLADALAPIVAPARGAAPGWPIASGLTLGYSGVAGRLVLVAQVELDATIDGRQVITDVSVGLSIGASGAPSVVLDASVALDGRGLRVSIAPALRVELVRPTPATPIVLYPATGGLGSLLEDIGAMVLPPMLDAIRDHRTDASPSLGRDVARAINELVTALDLLEADHVSGARLELFAANPASWTAARLPALAASGLSELAHALDPGASLVAVSRPTLTTTLLEFGPSKAIGVTLDGGATPAISLHASLDIDGVGHLELESLRLWAGGLQISALIGPLPLDLGAATLRPMAVVRAGVSSVGFERLIGVGLALDDSAANSVEVRWTLDAQPPSLVHITRGLAGETVGSAAQAGLDLLAIAVSLAAGAAMDALGPVITSRATAGLQGVLFTDVVSSTDIDPAFFIDLLDIDELVKRLKRLAWNLSTTAPLSITIESTVTIGLAADNISGGRKRLGVNVSLVPNKRFAFPTAGDVKVELEVDASWVVPAEPPGLSIFVLEGVVDGGGEVQLDLQPAVVVAGLGLRFTKTSGPLLDLGGLGIDGIGLSLYGEAAVAGLGGGVRLMLEGLAFSPAAGGGSNPVANSIMNDAGTSGSANRPAFSPSIAIQQHPAGALAFSVRAGQPPGPWWIVVQRQLGPLYLERVGFDTAEVAGTVTRVTLLFDGSVSLFGLTAAVDQLSLSWLGGDVFDIHSWSVDLMGLAVSADIAGASLSGGLLKTVDGGVTSYVGMLMGRFGIYGLSVFGGYADDHGSPSFFVFGAVVGPIGGPPAFFLTGLGGGLGINRGLKIPTDLSNFGEFPFLKALDPGATASNDPMGELRKLAEYFPPQSGNFWFAAGISFNSFALVDGVAVVAVSFGDGLEINILGLARMALPRPQAALVSIELALRVQFSTVEGVFMIQAQLTENSWLLYPEVRLTGGFAFAVWWKGPLAGQFVLSIGGYHPDFHRDGYPEVPRLGLVWQFGDYIVIKGGSYFALTSEALMAGVDVEVSADFGWAWAKISFGAHGIVYFDPFWFEVMAYARISAGIEIDTFFGTISFSISLGASIRVWGPDFSGEATLEIGPCEFTVGFGSDRKIAAALLDWPTFVGKYLEDSGSGTARSLSSITGRGTLPAATGGKVGAPSSDGTAQRPFEVFAEFELSIVTTVPTTAFDLAGGAPVKVTVKSSNGALAALGVSPMGLSALASTMRVVLDRYDPIAKTWVPQPAKLGKLAANLRAGQPHVGGSTFGTDAYPIGAWGTPVPPNLIVKPLPAGDVLFAGSRLQLVAEAETMQVGPQIDYYRVEHGRRPLPLRSGGSDRIKIRAIATGVSVFKPVTVAAALTAASTVLFAPRASSVPGAVLPDGLLPTGIRSGVERAAFVGQRCAPPMFGSLADGLAKANGDDAVSQRVTPDRPERFLTARAPFVAGYLTSGAGAVIRNSGTTVADGRIKRRTSPSLDSVQSRLGRSLPIQLGRTAVPAAGLDGVRTVVAMAATLVPRTAVPGATVSFTGGPVGARGVQGLVAGLAVKGSSKPRRGDRSRSTTARADDPGTIVRSGDVVVLQAPDSMFDTQTASSSRPTLHIAGRARVTVLAGDGGALFDGDVNDDDVSMPPGFALIGVQADASIDLAGRVGAGMAGWHDRSRIVQLGSHSAIVPGALITVDGSNQAAGGLGWLAAGDMTAGATALVTRFALPVRTIAIALVGDDVVRFDQLALELGGADLAIDADGKPREPIVVQIGSTSVLVYSIIPDAPDGDSTVSGVADPLVVRVRGGSNWAVVAVLGGDDDPDDLATRIARNGIVSVAAKLLATSGPGATFTWRTGRQPTRRGGRGNGSR